MTSGRRVLFLTGGGPAVGLGHVRRCLALAGALRDLGAESLFLLDGDPAVVAAVTAEGLEAVRAGVGVDPGAAIRACRERHAAAVVVDSYALGTQYLSALAVAGLFVAALDDLADRERPVGLVVNGSAGAERLAYRGASHTRYLLGPRYIPLRPEFAEPPAREFAPGLRRVLITVGGADPHGLTERFVHWTGRALGGVEQDVVVGPLFGTAQPLRTAARSAGGPVLLHEDPKEMRALMLGADLALAGGGQTTYELAATGTPAVAVRMADNQTLNLRGLAEAGALLWAGDAGDADLESALTDALAALAGNAARRAAMSRRGRELVDGQGAARVARAILEVAGGRAT
jgi:UDP-2,4-diacetamido-2,4,6-trideoxy-beta-L-altropyranose hydrolase